ncbi:MAG: ATP-grasp domain-containing protein [Jatrophihabitantaceae bacterium]
MTATNPGSSAKQAGDRRPHLLVISTGARMFREYLLAQIATRYRVHLFLAGQPDWEVDYIDAATVLTNSLDAEEMIGAARQLNERDRIDGVLCWDEARVIATSQVAQALGLPGGDPEVVLGCRDKHLTRQRLAAAGVAQPRSIVVETLERALEAAVEIGYPVVLKPRGIAGSLGVVLAHDEAGLRKHFTFARRTMAPGALTYDEFAVLVEEYADGPEISVDSAVFHGQVHPICLAHKELGYPPYFEEIGHFVDGAEPMLSDPELISALEQAHAALGFTDGMTHTEYRLTPSGPKLIEVNARLGGDLIPYLGMRATGIDPGLAAAAIACGQEPEVVSDRTLSGAVRFRYVPYEMTIKTIGFDQKRLPDGLDLAVVLAAPGQRLSPPPAGTVWGRIAYLSAIADTAEHCRSIIDAADAALVLTGTAVNAA